MSIYFSLACSRASGDAALSRFSCGDPKLCLPDFLKMLLLALPQIYTREFHLWRSIDLDRASVRDSRPCKFFSLVCSPAFLGAVHSRFSCWNLELLLLDFLKMLVMALHQIYTRVFHTWKFVALDNAWVGDSRPCQFVSLP